MKEIKRWIAVVLAVCMAAGLAVYPVSIQEAGAVVTAEGNYDYEILEDQTIEITSYSGSDTVLEVPAQIDGKTVSGINGAEGGAPWDGPELTEIIFPEGVRSIVCDLGWCKKLKRVVIPSSADYVDCGLNGGDVDTEFMGYDVAADNPYYTSVDGVLFDKEKITLLSCPVGKTGIYIVPSSVTAISGWAFNGCKKLTQIILTEQITTIEEGTFWGCTGLSSMEIPAGVTSIDEDAFGQCTGLQAITVEEGNPVYASIDGVIIRNKQNVLVQYPAGKVGAYTIPEGISTVNEMAFTNCAGLTEITIPAAVGDLFNKGYNGYFAGCTNLQNIYVDSENGVYESDDGILYEKGKKRLLRCPQGKNGAAAIADGTVQIGENAFTGCGSLTAVTIPDSVSVIETEAFYNCNKLAEIRLSDSISEIEAYAFGGCTELTELVVPDGVKELGLSVIEGCKKLRRISIPASVENINEFSYDYAYYNSAYDCESLTAIDVAEDNSCYTSIQGVLFNKEETTLLKYPIGKEGEYVIPTSVSSIGNYAFYNSRNLTKISIPDSVKNIGEFAFVRCEDLTEIVIPNSVTAIGEGAFAGCVKLETVGLPSQIDIIEDRSFVSCTNLKTIIMPDSIHSIGEYAFADCKNLTEIVIPDSVDSIGYCAFWGCSSLENVQLSSAVTEILVRTFQGCSSLHTVSIPVSVQSIAGRAFYQCPVIHDVYYGGTTEQWNQLAAAIDGGNLSLTLPPVIHFKSGMEGEENGFRYRQLNDDTLEITSYTGTDTDVKIPAAIRGKAVSAVADGAFSDCNNLLQIEIPASVLSSIGAETFSGCASLQAVQVDAENPVYASEDGILFDKKKEQLLLCPQGRTGACTIPSGTASVGELAFENCKGLKEVSIPVSIREVKRGAFNYCAGLKDVYYAGIREQWDAIIISTEEVPGKGRSGDSGQTCNQPLLRAVIHFSDGTTLNGPEEEENINTAKKELQKLKAGDALSLDKELLHYLSPQQIDAVESYIYTWLAEMNYAYRYQGNSEVKRLVMAKAGLDPEGDFVSGSERAVTHITVDTKYGSKSIEVTLDIGKPDGSGNLYPSYGKMNYEILEKDNLPDSIPKAGQIGKASYTDMARFVSCVEQADNDTLHNTFQWQELDPVMTAGILIDKTVMELTGPQNGSFYDGVYTVYEMALLHYGKKVVITGPVNVYVRYMDNTQCGAIINDQAAASAGKGSSSIRKGKRMAAAGAELSSSVSGMDENVRLEVSGGTKTVYLAKDDYYINLEGTGNGTMNYTVEEMIGEDTKRKVEFLRMALEKDLKYEGYVFEPLGIDKDLYALKVLDGSNTVVTPDSDDFRSIFRKITGLSLNQSDTQLDASRTIQLNASLFPLDASNKNLKWTTDNGAVATVGPDGLVTAAGAGRAVVTVSTLDGSSLKASCVIVVSDGRKPGQEPGNSGSGSSGNSGGSGNSGSSGGSMPQNPSAPSNPSVPAVQPSAPSSPSVPSVPVADIITGPVVEQLFYIVSFDVNGGKNLSRRTMTLLKDEPLGILPKAQKDQYLFSGWYTQRNGGKEITSGTVLDGAATLYARWTRAEKPGKVKALKLKTGKKKQIKVSFQKVKGARGYQILCSASRKFPASGTKKTDTASRTAAFKKLKKGKAYYIKIRAYTLDSAQNKIYGAYSPVKKTKLKK